MCIGLCGYPSYYPPGPPGQSFILNCHLKSLAEVSHKCVFQTGDFACSNVVFTLIEEMQHRFSPSPLIFWKFSKLLIADEVMEWKVTRKTGLLCTVSDCCMTMPRRTRLSKLTLNATPQWLETNGSRNTTAEWGHTSCQYLEGNRQRTLPQRLQAQICLSALLYFSCPWLRWQLSLTSCIRNQMPTVSSTTSRSVQIDTELSIVRILIELWRRKKGPIRTTDVKYTLLVFSYCQEASVITTVPVKIQTNTLEQTNR
jgi:hypothetical protein